MRFIFFTVFFKRLSVLKKFMRDKTVPKRKKLIIVFGIVYLFLPVDLIPPVFFPFGFIDDLLLWIYIIYYLKDELDKYWMGIDEKEEKVKKETFKNKNIIDADFQVEEEE